MIACRRRRRSLLSAAWRGSALTAAFALIGLVVISGVPGSPRLALRANTYNQMTGIGSTASALTVNWTSGLLNSANQPITGSGSTDGAPELNPNSDRAAGTGSLFFMDSDFASLKVTVSQTQDITHQGITVGWTGAQNSNNASLVDFMQLMECYGDSASGPSPEGCEYGSPRMLGSQIPNQQITTRVGLLCTAGAAPSTASPPSSQNGAGPPSGCDPNELAAETPAHCDPGATGLAACSGGQFSVPFVPADDPASPLYGAGAQGTGTGTLFNQFNTNEVQAAYTATDGTGQRQFETLTATQAPGLGCGEAESNGQTRSCWLVIVPRGTFEPNGFKANTVPLETSPLSAGNWAQRIQVHLGYSPLAANCPPTVIPDAMVGTQVIYRAVTSWQSALNQAANCTRVYSYTATTEHEATDDLNGAGSGGAGLAFTTVPIGSEIARDGLQPTSLPAVLYAPVAVTADSFGFNVNTRSTGQLATPVNLTPSLLAKALTQVYGADLPDATVVGFNGQALGPPWVQNNPVTLYTDPAFTAVNQEIPTHIAGAPTFPLITGDHSGDIQQVWQWIQSDSATASWLDGADPSNPVTADPNYVTLNLGKSPAADNFDEAYKGTLTCADVVTDINECATVANGQGAPDLSNPASRSCVIPTGDTANPNTKACLALTSENLLPVENNFDQAAAVVLTATDPGNNRTWDPSALAASGTSGWFDTFGVEQPGSTFMWAVNDMPDLAAYGLVSAALCDPAGTNCVQASTDSVTAALNSATPDSAGLLQVNPATVPSGGYPLTDVVYAAVPTNQPASALTDYANFISYAAGQGQTAGTAPGDLPPGYLPLPASLQAQAQSVVTQLQALAGGSASPTASPTATATGTATGGTTTGSTTTGGTTTGGTITGGTTTGGTTGGTTTGGTTTGGTTGGGTTGGTTNGGTTTGGGATTPATRPAGSSTCTSTASTPTASPSRTAAATAAPASTGCASATPQPFNVLPPAAQAAAGTTPLTAVGGIRGVLIIVLIIGAAGALAGGLLRYGSLPGRGLPGRGLPGRGLPGRSRPRRRTGGP